MFVSPSLCHYVIKCLHQSSTELQLCVILHCASNIFLPCLLVLTKVNKVYRTCLDHLWLVPLDACIKWRFDAAEAEVFRADDRERRAALLKLLWTRHHVLLYFFPSIKALQQHPVSDFFRFCFLDKVFDLKNQI